MKFSELNTSQIALSKGELELEAAISKKYKFSSTDLAGVKHNIAVIRSMMDDPYYREQLPLCTSGDPFLDIILGGGWRLGGKMYKVSGKFSVGKSFLLVKVMSYITRVLKKKVLLLDTENRYSLSWLLDQGVDITLCRIARPVTTEMMFDIAENAFESGEYIAIFMDSVANSVPQEKLDKTHDEKVMAKLANLFTMFCQKFSGRTNKKMQEGFNAADLPNIFYTNQIRTNPMARFKKDYTPGGSQQDNTSSIILDMYQVGSIKSNGDTSEEEDEGAIGWDVKVTVGKNNFHPAKVSCTLGLLNQPFAGLPSYSYFQTRSLVIFAEKLGLIVKKGAWFEVPEFARKYQGLVKFSETIVQDRELRKYLVNAIKNALEFPVAYPWDLLEKCDPIEYSLSELYKLSKTTGIPATEKDLQKQKEGSIEPKKKPVSKKKK